MAPRTTDPPAARTGSSRAQRGPSQDRRRDIEDKSHHPVSRAKPRASHKPQKKKKLPPRHTPHSHPHGEELGPHVNKPSPIKPEKKITRTGSKKKG